MELHLSPLQLPISDGQPLIIAGPCAAETEEQVLTTAHQLAHMGVRIFRAGAWKPRTKPGGFEGQGALALPWLQRVKAETGMLVATEVATPEHVKQALEHQIDLLWIGARTTANPFAMQALADALKDFPRPILVKNPTAPDLELWIGALERLNQAGITQLAAIHRGFASYEEKIYRNKPMWQIPIELHRRLPALPIICDPSHIAGRRDLVEPLAQQAMDLGFDGLIIESHCNPQQAWSDAAQQLTPESLRHLLGSLTIRDVTASAEDIRQLRNEIDELDDQLMDTLAQRMSICREIGRYKREHNMTVLQPSRYSDMLSLRLAEGAQCKLSAHFVAKMFECIHAESVRQQIEIFRESDRQSSDISRSKTTTDQ
ncbi:MAG: bifunctional 3-deoxy-7-phosphoheptulonate synthase/chorismate mutase type II [Prevotella sp.]|nr:bifunctional 3-deoxy-7-phosphoheptulonate synthase/chorismate mutase type II [Prevotella sp.]